MLRILIFCLCLCVAAGAEKGRPWHAQFSRAQLEQMLARSPVLSMSDLASNVPQWSGSNPYQVLRLRGGISGVFRSEDEPWGSLAELAGYRFDRWLGTDLVPPTVARTLRRADLPPGSAWPWPGEQRQGSVQLWVTGARPLPAHDLPDPEVLGFVLGRYDNHEGNLLKDLTGRPLVVDFESTLDLQQVRYGDFAFVKRGRRVPGSGLPASSPFPFDAPARLVDPSLEQIQSTFGTWWTDWTEGMAGLHRMLRHIPERTIPYVVWDERLWVQVRVASRHPVYTSRPRTALVQRLSQLSEARVRELLGAPYGPEHVRGVLDRVGQLRHYAQHVRVPEQTRSNQ